MGNDVCANCGAEQQKMFRPCTRCRSRRVIALSVAEQLGPDWRDALKDPPLPGGFFGDGVIPFENGDSQDRGARDGNPATP